MFLGFRKPFTAVQKECATPPHVQVRLHVISFTRPSPALVLQVTNAGVRRPGYKDTCTIDVVNLYTLYVVRPNYLSILQSQSIFNPWTPVTDFGKTVGAAAL